MKKIDLRYVMYAWTYSSSDCAMGNVGTIIVPPNSGL